MLLQESVKLHGFLLYMDTPVDGSKYAETCGVSHFHLIYFI